jgi:acyl-CoA reductase-like NAD-dependent aldehyde dehydrogenase
VGYRSEMALRFPDPPPSVAPTSLDVLDGRLEALARKKDEWTQVSLKRRLQILRRLEDAVQQLAAPWAALCARAAGYFPDDNQAGEYWLAGPMVTARALRLLREALQQNGQPKAPLTLRRDGRWAAKVFPTNLTDALFLPRTTAEVWLEPGAEPTQGRVYRDRHPGPGQVALVLGAGNIPAIAPTDVLYKMFVDDQVVVLKLNPVNEYQGPILEQIFQPLIDDGFMTVAYGGAEVGKHLANHPLVDTLHITGSNKTYDAIVWGADPEERARRKQSGDKRVDKPFTSELGNVTPILVVPGAWSEAELDYNARHVVAAVVHNASFDCVAGKVLVLAAGWDQRDAFLERVKQKLRAAPPRKAYYPGAESRWQAFMAQYPTAEVLGSTGEGIVPWTLLPGVPPHCGEYALCNEAFCGVLGEVSLDARGPEDFLKKAVPFVNDNVWGTLACMLLTDGRTEKRCEDAFETALEQLRYGTIGVNIWPGAIFGLMNPTWGAFPGHTDEDIVSGRGAVHNAFLFDHPEKSVVRAAPRLPVTPPWFADHRNLLKVGEGLTRLEARYSPLRLAALLPSLMKG